LSGWGERLVARLPVELEPGVAAEAGSQAGVRVFLRGGPPVLVGWVVRILRGVLEGGEKVGGQGFFVAVGGGVESAWVFVVGQGGGDGG